MTSTSTTPTWGGDYHNPDSYTGGLPVEMAIRRDLDERFRALDQWQCLPFKDRHPDLSPELLAMREGARWADAWLHGTPEPQPRAIRWIAS